MVKASTYRYNSTGNIFELNSYVDYEYNDKGLRAKEAIYRYNQNVEAYVDNAISEYEYTDDGSLAKKIESARPSGAPWETDIKPMRMSTKVEYSDFIGINLPQKSESYNYSVGLEGGEGTWNLTNYSISTYDDNLFLVKKEYFNGNAQGEWTVSTRYTYVCNERGQVTYEEYGAKNNSTGIVSVSSKKTYTYDDNGNLSGMTGVTYQSYKDEWVVDSPYAYYYSPYSPTSIRNTGVQNVDVYYNVSGKEICFRAEDNIGGICIYSVTGLEVMRVPAVNNSRYALNVSGLEKGLYVVSMISDGEVYNKKIYIYE